MLSSNLEQSIIPEGTKGVPEAPEEEFEVEYVYGYRTFDCRQNLRYNAKGQPVYMVAALGVILDTESNTQKVFGGKETKMVAKNESDDSKYHVDDILSLDISADRKTVVTGQVGKAPCVHVWDAETAEQRCTFKLKEGSRGVSGISISPCQRYVACVDLHNDHHVVIYNIKRAKQLLHIEGSKETILQVAWSKKADDLRFVTVGLKELKFWNPADATKRLSTKGTFGTKGAITNFLGAAFDAEGNCFTAGANGSIYVWDSNAQLDKVHKGHSAEISAIAHEGGKLFTGGKDKKILVHSTNGGDITLERTIDLDTSYPKSLDYLNGKLLVGLRNGQIWEFSDSGEKKLLLASHHEGETWGLEVISEDRTILTTGDDNKIMAFDYANRRFVSQGVISGKGQPKNAAKAKKVTASTLSDMPPNQQGRAIAYNKLNGHVAVSNNMGKVSIRLKDNLDQKVKSLKDPQEWNEVIKYSPDGKYLAVGSHDNHIYVYNVQDNYSLYANFGKHNSFITALDWASDSSYIRSICGAYEKLYFNLATKDFDANGLQSTKDTVWASTTCKKGWEVEGCKPLSEDGSHINGVDVSQDKKLIATADDFGLLNVFRYPCLTTKHKARSYAGHSEHVVRALFTPDGQRIFTIGGYDKAVIQWKRK
ncbi:hypothetical protein FGO68_gene16014 [Halteria grandinella]|uniref:Uncharacterized protein n=1 Tax=Halteria grandinella TaxID=5974 RepID=A0A8J8NYD3_HALGN|nr:hypothetical protein FGO68_gene16014 [Halteria grandinella]